MLRNDRRKKLIGPLGVALLLLVAAAVRLAYRKDLSANPFHGYPIIDAAEYWGWASRIAGGEWLWTRVHIHGPLYPYLLALIQKSGRSFDTVYFVQSLFGLGVLLLVFDIGRITAGRKTGLIAMAITLLYSRFLYFESLLLATTLVMFLDLLLLRVSLELVQRRSGPGPWMIPGVLAGLSAITRPTILITLPALLAWSALRGGKSGRFLRPAAIFAGLLLVVAPVTVRNIRIGDPVLIQANGGMNFYIANRAGGDGLASVRPGIEWKRIERVADRAGAVRESEKDRLYYKEGLRSISDAPLHALRTIGKRFLLFWGGWEVDTSQDFRFYRSASPSLRFLFLPAGVIVPLALFGVLFAFRRRTWDDLLLLFLLSYMVAVLLFPYSSRYRLPVFPILALYAASILNGIAGYWKERRVPWGNALLLSALFILLNFFPIDLPEEGVMRTHLHLGRMLDGSGDPRGAISHYDRVLTLNRKDADAWNDRGLAMEKLGEMEEARRSWEEAVRSAPDHGKAHANLAGIHFSNGAIDSSLSELEIAAKWEPRNADFRNNLGVLLLKKGRTEEAITALEYGARIAPRNREVLFNLGRAYEQADRFEDSRNAFLALLVIGETKEARMRLGVIYEKMRLPADAAGEYRRALQIDPEYAEAHRAIGILFLRVGKEREALDILEHYLTLQPKDEWVRLRVRELRDRESRRKG